MSFRLFIDTACPKCHKPVKVCAIELHPTRGEIAIQHVQCADCGEVETGVNFTKAAQTAYSTRSPTVLRASASPGIYSSTGRLRGGVRNECRRSGGVT